MDLFANSTKIRNLNPDLFNTIVTGVILYRNPSKCSRRTLNLLLRDSRDNTVICVVWGPQSFVQEWWVKCSVGKIVTVSFVRVSYSTHEYHPCSTSPFIVTASDRSQITFQENSILRDLFYLPLKPIELALNLDDIKVNGEKGIGQNTDVLVLVRQVKPARRISMKNDTTKTLTLRECVVCDQSNHGMLLTLWSEDFIERSDGWQPLTQVLHLVDVKIGYSSFYKSIFLMTTSKTVVMESPSHKRTQELMEFGLQLDPFDSTAGNRGGNPLPSPEDVKEVMTCQRVIDRMSSAEGQGDEDQFTGIVFAILTKFNIDGDSEVVKKKCSFCHSSVVTDCMEDICLDLRFQTSDATYLVYDLRLDFSDHTGTLSNCRLLNAEGEQTFNCSAEKFQFFPWSQKCGLKWKYLMERCRVKIIVYKKTVYRPHSFVRIIEIKLVDQREVQSKIKIY